MQRLMSIIASALNPLFVISYSAKFLQGKFWHFWCFPASYRPWKFNPSNCLKQYSVYRCMVKDSEHPSKYFSSNIWRVSICQNFPRKNFALYSSYIVTCCISNRSRGLYMMLPRLRIVLCKLHMSSKLTCKCHVRCYASSRVKFYFHRYVIIELSTWNTAWHHI